MARMIPAIMDPATVSPGESEMYRRLRDDPATQGWVVLHSLLLRKHPTQVAGEADFVVIVPSLGVVVVEVKGCRSLRVDEGIWYYGRSGEGDPRSPFRQASDAMHAIRGHVTTTVPHLRNIPFWSAVAFPFLNFDIASEEWHPWQVIDATSFRRTSFADDLAGVLGHARTHLHASQGARWFDPASTSPTPQEVDALIATLRPRFELIESRKQRRHRREEELLTLTREQYEALDTMDANERVVFEGPAGTGKTLLALEAARRASMVGHRVLLACFNRALGKWLREQARDLGTPSYVGTFSSYMLKVSALSPTGRHRDPDFWNDELPSEALEALLDGAASSAFDEVILDEAQDLLHEPFLDVLDVSLKGGLSAGRWRMFGDFERQAIYGRDLSVQALLEERGSNAPIHSLRVNCRNTPRIAALTRLLAGLTPDYRRVRRPDDGVEPDLVFFDPGEERSALAGALVRCYSQGLSGPDIVVLSASARAPLASLIEDQPWCDRLQPMDGAGQGAIRYGTIHGFKGLEANAVVVTDLQDVDGDEIQSLLYVALTRAIDRLVVLFPRTAAAKVAARLSRVAEELSDAR